MTSSNHQQSSSSLSAIGIDDRWEGNIPWFLRYATIPSVGNFDTFFSRVSQTLHRLMTFNEGEILNQDHFGTRLETDSLQRYRHALGKPLGEQLQYFFDAGHIWQKSEAMTSSDQEERLVGEISAREKLKPFPPPMHGPPESEELRSAGLAAAETRAVRWQRHFSRVVIERLGVLETVLVDLHKVGARRDALSDVIRDLRRALAEARIPLDIRGTPPSIIPMDDALLQTHVIDLTLARVRARWPQRADELLGAYHDAIAGRKLDEVFGAAFKSLEEIARSLTGDPRFDLSARSLRRCFPSMHPTVQHTIEKLREHRGDAAGHGRKKPNPNEIRYLLLHICNTVLLLLDMEPELQR